MSKYNIELNLEENNSMSVIIKMIMPNTRVLEFGPANGRMTKYLKESLGCTIDIVELDEDAGFYAKKYAEISLIGNDIGDIENYKWFDILANNQYDYIIFADVLEHLYNPQEALRKSKQLLKKNGFVLISIPNIGHNDILLNLYYDRFEYTQTGLLDNTHIRFWGAKELDKFIKSTGLHIVNIDTISINTFETEQSRFLDERNDELEQLLRKRDLGNVYQFILKLGCNSNEEIYVINQLRSFYEYFMNLYFDTGNGYNEIEKINKIFKMQKFITSKFVLPLESLVKVIRFDPIEGFPCMIKLLDINTDGIIDKTVALNGYYDSSVDKEIFLTTDPMYEIYGDFTNATYIEIKIEIDLINQTDVFNQLR